MEIVTKIYYNWHQAGSTETRDGAGESFGFFELGKEGVTEIREFSGDGFPANFLVSFEDGHKERIFNPNRVFYNETP